jgi:hypothetical protein
VDGSPSKEVSYFIAAETTKKRVMTGRPFAALAEVEARLLRQLDYALARDPDGCDGDASHVVACPSEAKTRKEIERDARVIKAKCSWVPT